MNQYVIALNYQGILLLIMITLDLAHSNSTSPTLIGPNMDSDFPAIVGTLVTIYDLLIVEDIDN